MELDLSDIQPLVNPLSFSGEDDKKLDLSDISPIKLDSTTTTPKKNSGTLKFQPSDSNWGLDKLPDIENFYQQTFGTNLPGQAGQKSIHNKWGYDHRNSMDVNLNPNSKEGKQLIAFLESKNIPYLGFTKAIPGVATGAHIHIGFASHKTDKKYTEGTKLNSELDLSDITPIKVDTTDIENQEELDLSDTTPIKVTDEDAAKLNNIVGIDPNKIGFKIATRKEHIFARDVERANTPNKGPNNPNAVGDLISTEIDFGNNLNPKKRTQDQVNKITDTWLLKWNPEYAALNTRFREETGGLNLALVDSPANLEPLGNGKYKITSRPSAGVTALFESYKKDGLAGFNVTSKLIDSQIEENNLSYEAAKKTLDTYREQHPYISAIKSAGQEELLSTTHLARNITALPKALYYGNRYGYDSQQFIDEVNKETEVGQQLAEAEESTYKPPTLAGKITKGVVGGVLALPRFAAAGRTIGLPTMVYFENLHKGNREAAMAALPMAIMAGVGHGLGKFTETTGEGTFAPFAKVSKNELSLFQDTILNKAPVSIRDLTPLERQFLLRGSNAVTMAGIGAASKAFAGQPISLQDTISDLVIGLSFPVGKARRIVTPIEPTKISQVETSTEKIIPQGLSGGSIILPITEAPRFGTKFGLLENQRDIAPVIYPSSESPNVDKYGESFDPHKFVGETETGFQARGSGSTIQLDLDTAAMNWLDLQRALENNTISSKDNNLQTQITNRNAAQKAYDILNSQLSPEVKEFFTKNEDVIRAALKTNHEAANAKAKVKLDLNESQKPNEIRPVTKSNDVVDPIKQVEIDKTLGNRGTLNKFTEREKAYDIYKTIFNITTPKNQSSILPYGDVFAKKVADLTYLAAFHVEDFYHRGIEPSFSLVMNRLREDFGDLVSKLKPEQLTSWYNNGVDYFNSNNADSFFSKMKQDAVEKLPNRFDANQAKNILRQHGNEFDWTVGLKEFLVDKEVNGEKISKQELIDVIQKGQVRVEASIAQDLSQSQRDRIQYLDSQIRDLDNIPPEEYTQFHSDEHIKLIRERDATQDSINNQPKYSLKTYTGEKLELPGAVNSKEVKLITNSSNEWKQIGYDPDTETYFYRNANTGEEKESNNPILQDKMVLYNPPHWDEPNVVAHYRSNDRTTTDNIPIHFSEEFQSDWNHDIREQGLKLTGVARENEIIRLRQRINDIEKVNEGLDQVPFQHELEELYTKVNRLEDSITNPRGIEPNPFMSHAWKELVFKRFLRDAVVTKDENGNYKYEGIGWTTARQQKERYGKILEGKDFTWRKNSDETYTFQLKTNPNSELFTNPHELDSISLERFAELTTKEAAEEVRSQEVLIKKTRNEYNIPNDQIRYNTGVPNFNYEGKFSLKEAVELRSGIGKYSDYDVAMVNYAKKIGKRFGAEYSQKDIPITGVGQDAVSGADIMKLAGRDINEWINLSQTERDNLEHEYRSGKIIKNELIHFLEITPSMRESLSKEGFALYRLGASEKLSTKEIGVRNKIVSSDIFDEAKNDLVKSLTETLPQARRLQSLHNIISNSIDIISNREPALLKELTEGLKNLLDNKFNYTKEGREKISNGEVFSDKNTITDGLATLTMLADEGVVGFTIPKFTADRLETIYNRSNKAFERGDTKLGQAILNLADNLSGFVDKSVSVMKNNPEFSTRVHEAIHRTISEKDLLKGIENSNLFTSDAWKDLRVELHSRNAGWERIGVDRSDNIHLANELLAYGLTNDYGLVAGQLNASRKIVDLALQELIKNINTISGEEAINSLREISSRTNRKLIDSALYSNSRLESNTVFNSGLSPEAFLDQTKLLYKGLRDFSQFSKEMLTRFGETVKPYLEALWMHVKDFHENEKGSLALNKINKKNLELDDKALKEYLNDPEKHQGRISDLRYEMSSTGLAQWNPEFDKVYTTLRRGQRSTNGFSSFVLKSLQAANKSLLTENHVPVGEVLYKGLVEDTKVYSRSELLSGDSTTNRPALNANQADAYESFYVAQHANLKLRRETILEGMRKQAFKLNDKLASATPEEEGEILHRMGELSDRMDGVKSYYKDLMDNGYFSLQRKGEIAAYIEGANGEPIYQQFEKTIPEKVSTKLSKSGAKAAQVWINEQIANGAKADTQSIHDIRKLDDLSTLSKKLGIGAFEDLVDSSGVASHSPEIEKLRDEIYSQFPSYSYQLSRDFTKGYDRTWESALTSVIDQTEKYASSFYSRVAGEDALIKLGETNLQKTDHNLYQLAKAYIEDETISYKSSAAIKALSYARAGVYAWQLGYDFSQLYMNAIGQPITHTYNYFARVVHPETGERLKGLEPEKYFEKGVELTIQLAKDYASPVKNPSQEFLEFKDIYNRLKDERVIEPEFARSLLELETESLGKDITSTTLQKATSLKQHLHWAGIFMRGGEKTTRTHAAAEAFLVGKNKFKMEDEQLVDFVVRAVDATQSNPSRGDNPYIIRRGLGTNSTASEINKNIYQFNKFNQMWTESVALNVRSDIRNKTLGASIRTLYPLLIVGGLRGFPLAPLALGLYTIITGDDPKKKMDSAFKNHETLEQYATYGISGSAALSNKLTPSVPFSRLLETGEINLPVWSTSSQILKGLYDLSPLSNEKNYQKGLDEVAPRFAKGPIRTAKMYEEGDKFGKKTIIPKRDVTLLEEAGQFINIIPNKKSEEYDKLRTARMEAWHDRIQRAKKKIQKKVKTLLN